MQMTNGAAMEQESHSPLVQSALWWAEQGVPVFPCGADKAPLTKNGFKDAVTNPKEVVELFNFFGNRAVMIGGRMGQEAGMFAIDVDLYKGGEVSEWLDNMMARGLITDTRVHGTMRGGVHFLYESDRYPNVYPIDGVEVRGEGAYIIMTGSPGYRVLSEGLARASDALINELLKKQQSHARESVDDLVQKVLKAENFHDSLARLAARYSASGWPADKVQAKLVEVLRGSVAANPEHPRHDRWLFLLKNEGEEFSRLTSTSHRKYNSQAASEQMASSVEEDELRRLQEVARKSGFLPPPVGEPEPEPELKPEDFDGFPFEGLGYFASDEHELLNQKFVMHPIFAEDEAVLFAAAPKAGKTALSLTIGLHIACGLDLGTGLKVSEPRTVVYFGLEGRRAIKLRIKAWRMYMESEGYKLPEKIPFFVVERSTNLLIDEVRKDVVTRIIAMELQKEKLELPPLGAVFVDTFTKAMSGGDQNKVEDTSKAFEIVGDLRDAGVTATVVFIHHLSKENKVRGSSNIEADPDVLCKIDKNADIVNLLIDRARSIEEGGNYSFQVRNWDIGRSEQGYMINAPVVTAFVKEDDTKSGEELHSASVEQKILTLLVGLGAGTHSIQVVNDLLNENGLAVMADTRRRASSKPKPAAINTKKVQDFYDNLIPATGRVFGGFGISRVKVDDAISAIIIK